MWGGIQVELMSMGVSKWVGAGKRCRLSLIVVLRIKEIGKVDLRGVWFPFHPLLYYMLYLARDIRQLKKVMTNP